MARPWQGRGLREGFIDTKRGFSCILLVYVSAFMHMGAIFFPTPRNETAQMHELFKPAVYAHQTHTYYLFKTLYMHSGLVHTIYFGLALVASRE